MIIMAGDFTTSVNILRDTDRSFNYIPTPNAKRVATQITNDFKKGIRSFTIVGTYGTGKSSFLLAFEQSILGRKRFFEANFIKEPKVDFVKIIGSYSSIMEKVAEHFEVSNYITQPERIFSEIYNKYHSLGKDNRILFLFIDEFGKFLEYASKNDPENELYFIQQLAEFCNDPNHNIVLITTIHQGFESYSYSLTSTQKQEWVKVKGRFREITFNEPVEQLLFLASNYLEKVEDSTLKTAPVEECLRLSSGTKAFSINSDFLEEIAYKLFPLDILSASVLTLSLQQYGQNERSLFSFLESTDHTGLSKFNKKENPFFNLSCVYDYLNFNFYSYLISKYNPDFASWALIRASIEEVERVFDASINDYIKTVKTIGLLNIFSASGSILDRAFLVEYLKLTSGVLQPDEVIDNLEARKIIRYRNHSSRYILFEGTDLDIQTALIEAGNKISEVSDVVSLLNKYFRFPPIFAKLCSYEKGTPRFFEFVISDYPIVDKIPENELDGVINLIFNDKLNKHSIVEVSKDQEEAIVYCFFENSKEIKNVLFELEKLRKVVAENESDKVAKRELENIMDSQVRLLNHYITDSIYRKSGKVKWIFQGQQRNVSSKKDFNKLLSQVCNLVYSSTPIFKNELVNKHKISSSIHTAKRNYFKALANNWDKENLDFNKDRFPPEKTIYLSLLKENGISPEPGSSVKINPDSTFADVWRVSGEFVESAKYIRQPITDLIDTLRKRPFKLKQGLIDFWVTSYLFVRRDDFALFSNGIYVPFITDEVLDLLAKTPEDFQIKTFTIEGVKLDIYKSYRTLINQSPEAKVTNTEIIRTIKPFLTFYAELPEYAKNTNRLSKKAISLRNAISSSRDPEETFFEDFPAALGFSINKLTSSSEELDKYVTALKEAIRELRTSYEELVNRIEEFIKTDIIGEDLAFEEYKVILKKRYKKLKRHLLLSDQKVFMQRLDADIDDKILWINSLVFPFINCSLENITDDNQEMVLYDKFKSMILDLDSLTQLSKEDFNEEKEDVYSLQINSFLEGINKKTVRLPKAKKKEISKIQSDISSFLSGDNSLDLAALAGLLQEILKK